MNINFDPTGTFEGFQSILDKTLKAGNIEGLLILACDGNGFVADTMNDVLGRVAVPLFGGIFPAIIYGCEKFDRGTIIVGLHNRPELHIIPNLSNKNIDYYDAIEGFTPEAEDSKTMFVFVDGYSKMLNSLIESLYNNFGLRYNYIGGGAGSINPAALDMKHSRCLFTNNGLIEDSAVLALVNIESGVGVAHGWHKISDPYKVTESNGNAIQSLDWRPAFEVYKEIVKQHSGETITIENFFEIGKCFPFGILRMDSEVIIRDPFTVEDDSLIVATEIPQESFVHILTGNPDSIVKAASDAYSAAQEALAHEGQRTVFVADCISRALFLGDDFTREIEAVYEKNVPLIGVLSLGEIANSGKDFMELYNKTCAVAILSD